MDAAALRKWQLANRAAVHQDKRNRWVFIVSKATAQADNDIFRFVKGALGRLGNRVVDDVKLVRTSDSRIEPAGGAVQRRETIPEGPIPFVVPGPVAWAEVEFAWRAPSGDVAWVAEKYPLGLATVNDPTSSELMLDSVGRPVGVAAAQGHNVGETVDELISSSLASPQRAGLTLVGVGLLAYLLSRKLK